MTGMTFLRTPVARLLLGLLLFTLMLVAMSEVPSSKLQGSSNQPSNPSKQVVGNPESGEVRGPVPENPEDNENVDWEFLAEWTPWSPCIGNCGSGTQHRTRICGYKCATTEFQDCPLEPCPDNTEDKDKDKNDSHEENQKNSEPDTAHSIPDTLLADANKCNKWLSCKGAFISKYVKEKLQGLPSCPCTYPSEAQSGVVNLFDNRLGRYFRWKDASAMEELLDFYRPSAHWCLRTELWEEMRLGAQLCCYDSSRHLLTWGEGAGTPEIVSPDYSLDLHFTLDLFPRVICRGDWMRYQRVLPPNNGLSCPQRPPRRGTRPSYSES